jgi:TRAP-type mannitol/chloroaromatic compound transport system substrate-binding protein
VIEPYAAGAIADGLGVMDAVSKGEVQIGHSWSGYWVDKESYFELFSSIPNQMTAQEWIVWMYGPAKGMDLWKEAYAKYNIVPFPGGLVGPEFGFFTNKPVKTLDDFRGLKLRVSGLAADVARELGATTILTAPGDIKAAMQSGEIDGFEFSTPAIDWPMGFEEIASYVCLPSWHQPSAMFETTVNKDAYNALPDDLKAILEAACKEVSITDFFTYMEGNNAEYLQKFKDYGVEINVLDTQAMEEITAITGRLADAKAAESAFYARVLKSQRDFKADYRTWEKWGNYTLYP